MCFESLGFALGIVVKILFAPIAKRLQRKARPNAQILTIGHLEKLQFILLYWSERLRTPSERREGMRLKKNGF